MIFLVFSDSFIVCSMLGNIFLPRCCRRDVAYESMEHVSLESLCISFAVTWRCWHCQNYSYPSSSTMAVTSRCGTALEKERHFGKAISRGSLSWSCLFLPRFGLASRPQTFWKVNRDCFTGCVERFSLTSLVAWLSPRWVDLPKYEPLRNEIKHWKAHLIVAKCSR